MQRETRDAGYILRLVPRASVPKSAIYKHETLLKMANILSQKAVVNGQPGVYDNEKRALRNALKRRQILGVFQFPYAEKE